MKDEVEFKKSIEDRLIYIEDNLRRALDTIWVQNVTIGILMLGVIILGLNAVLG